MAEMELEPRESMEFDVVIIGGGPAGLSAQTLARIFFPAQWLTQLRLTICCPVGVTKKTTRSAHL
jgi:hypothetical protein